MKIVGIDHTSYTVASLARSLEFYAGWLGFELLWQRQIDNDYFRRIVGFPDCVVNAAHLRVPGSNHKLELFEYVTPFGRSTDLRTNNPGSSHLSLLVDDLPAVYGSLLSKGGHFKSPPVLIDGGVNRGGYAVYLLDPDGITVELFQPPSANQ